MATLTGATTTIVNSYEQAQRSEDLEWFRLRRFDRMACYLNEVMPKSDLRVRFVPIVSRVCRELAPQYVQSPSRTWSVGGEIVGGGRGLESLKSALRRARLDQFMRLVSERLVAQQSQVLSVEPRRVPARDGGMVRALGDLSLRAYSPFEVTITHRDHTEIDIRNADRVEIRVPVGMTDTGASRVIRYGKRIFTPFEAYTEVPAVAGAGPQRVPVFGEDVQHGFGFVPLVGVMRDHPPAGWSLPPVAHDLLECQISVNLALSDVLSIASYQVPVREYLIGPGASHAASAAKVISPRDLVPIDTAGEANEYDHVTVNPNPAIGSYLKAIEAFVRTWCANSFVSPESILSSASLTGDAKQWERLEQQQERERSAVVLRDAEQDIASLAASVLTHEGVSAVPSPDLAVRYHYTEPKGNDLQAAQARVVRGRFGEIDPVAEFARAEGIEDQDQARDQLAARLARWTEIFGAMTPDETPGLDATAAAL